MSTNSKDHTETKSDETGTRVLLVYSSASPEHNEHMLNHMAAWVMLRERDMGLRRAIDFARELNPLLFAPLMCALVKRADFIALPCAASVLSEIAASLKSAGVAGDTERLLTESIAKAQLDRVSTTTNPQELAELLMVSPAIVDNAKLVDAAAKNNRTVLMEALHTDPPLSRITNNLLELYILRTVPMTSELQADIMRYAGQKAILAFAENPAMSYGPVEIILTDAGRSAAQTALAVHFIRFNSAISQHVVNWILTKCPETAVRAATANRFQYNDSLKPKIAACTGYRDAIDEEEA